MGLISKLKNRFKISKKIKKIVKPFLDRIFSDTFAVTLEIFSCDNLLLETYGELKREQDPKYSKYISRIEEAFKIIEENNKKISEIYSVVSQFDYDSILKNPKNFDYSTIDNFLHTADLIKKYKKIPLKYDEYVKNVEIISKYYQELLRQHDLLVEYNNVSNINNINEYIDANNSKEIINKRDKIRDEFSTFQQIFYHLNTDEEFLEEVKQHNEDFIKQNKDNSFFDNINGRSLDSEQREAVLTDELSTLVIAGAGSGKTLTICGKVEYLLNVKHIDPKEILLLSYSKKSADDLQTKIDKIDSRLSVGTFHKIGLDILKETKNKTFMVEDQFKAIIESYFRDEMKNRPHMLQTILTYYGLYISSDKHNKTYDSKGEMYEDIKKMDFSTLKSQLISLSNNQIKKETIKKELVKSFEEMAIANWYFINGIDYEYESPYVKDVSTYDRRQYMPDFYLKKYKIYHEHYGIDKSGKANQFSGSEAIEYVNNMKWKRAIHKENNTICIETYSYEFEDGTVFTKLEEKLKAKGVVFKPLSNEQIFNSLESIYEGQAFKSFINLIRTFLSLFKSLYRTADGFDELKKYSFNSIYEKKRADLFLDIAKDIYLFYIDRLRKEGKIDFDDMILQSMISLDNTNNFKYKYVIVDEFQDISQSRMLFLKKLISHGGAKLFAVGDDWQAIYRFSGCDLNVFLNFQNYFGNSAIRKITTTHRNSQELQDIAGPFIKANPEQINKKINSSKHLEHPVRIMYYSDKKYDAFLNIVKQIYRLNKNAKVLILGRNNKDFESIALDDRIYIDRKATNETTTVVKVRAYPTMRFSYCTVHGSKGLEEDYVIIINADDSRLGFPNKMEDDELLDMVLSSKSEYEYAEERRLWYVALTRTRTYTYIISKIDSPSIFVEEIKNQCLIMNDKNEFDDLHTNEISCPNCKTGKLILRTNEHNKEQFYGCSNYPYCDYTIKDLSAVKQNRRCKMCGDFLIYRRGPFGSFYGCHSYPLCDYTEEYVSQRKKH